MTRAAEKRATSVPTEGVGGLIAGSGAAVVTGEGARCRWGVVWLDSFEFGGEVLQLLAALFLGLLPPARQGAQRSHTSGTNPKQGRDAEQ
ncbi:MAG: hypothetical protein WC740_18225 [Verrucomicrobiia bacterium]